MTAKGTENHEKYIRNVCRGNKRALGLETVYITKSEREKKEALTNLSKEILFEKIRHSLSQIPTEEQHNFSEKIKDYQRSKRSTSKTDLIQILSEINEQIDERLIDDQSE